MLNTVHYYFFPTEPKWTRRFFKLLLDFVYTTNEHMERIKSIEEQVSFCIKTGLLVINFGWFKRFITDICWVHFFFTFFFISRLSEVNVINLMVQYYVYCISYQFFYFFYIRNGRVTSFESGLSVLDSNRIPGFLAILLKLIEQSSELKFFTGSH